MKRVNTNGKRGCLGNILLLVLLVCAVPGCVSLKQPNPKVEHYTLEYASPAPIVLKAGSGQAMVVRVERFSAAPMYDTDRMVYREGEFDRSSYIYHRWRSKPADLVTYFLTRDLRHSGLFTAVDGPGSSQPHTHVLEGIVDEFVEWDSHDGWKAVVSLTLTLVASREPDVSRQVVFQHSFSAEEPCLKKHPLEVARAMSLAMAKLSGDVNRFIHAQLN